MLDLIIAIDDEGLIINTHSHIQVVSGGNELCKLRPATRMKMLKEEFVLELNLRRY